MVVVFFAGDGGTTGTGFGVDAYTKGHAAGVEGVMVGEFAVGFEAFLDMDAGVNPWADVVYDSAVRQGFFDPFMAGVVDELEA